MNLRTFKLNAQLFRIYKSILSPETKFLFDLFRNENYALKIAGGAVRDILMNKIPHDIDFASDATPTEMKNLFTKHQIRLINTNGESHGTITTRINDKENFEITTLRYDLVTDGRRAEVVFTKDWAIDAERRDLTINSLFLDEDGVVYDYFGGSDDLEKRIVRFVGDSTKRIQEDYLRILRYFRFYGRISTHSNQHLDEVVDSICKNADGLDRISGERIWTELSKIISGNYSPEIYQVMHKTNVVPHIGLSVDNFTEKLIRFRQFYPNLQRNNAENITYLSLIIDNQQEVNMAHSRMKFSNLELFILRYLIDKRDRNAYGDALLKQIKDEICMWNQEKFINRSKLKECQIQFLKMWDEAEMIEEYTNWKAPTFPVNGNNLRISWNVKGKAMGSAMAFLKNKWFESDYKATEEELLEYKEVYMSDATS